MKRCIVFILLFFLNTQPMQNNPQNEQTIQIVNIIKTNLSLPDCMNDFVEKYVKNTFEIPEKMVLSCPSKQISDIVSDVMNISSSQILDDYARRFRTALVLEIPDLFASRTIKKIIQKTTNIAALHVLVKTLWQRQHNNLDLKKYKKTPLFLGLVKLHEKGFLNGLDYVSNDVKKDVAQYKTLPIIYAYVSRYEADKTILRDWYTLIHDFSNNKNVYVSDVLDQNKQNFINILVNPEKNEYLFDIQDRELITQFKLFLLKKLKEESENEKKIVTYRNIIKELEKNAVDTNNDILLQLLIYHSFETNFSSYTDRLRIFNSFIVYNTEIESKKYKKDFDFLVNLLTRLDGQILQITINQMDVIAKKECKVKACKGLETNALYNHILEKKRATINTQKTMKRFGVFLVTISGLGAITGYLFKKFKLYEFFKY